MARAGEGQAHSVGRLVDLANKGFYCLGDPAQGMMRLIAE